jgi:hypothetical protein
MATRVLLISTSSPSLLKAAVMLDTVPDQEMQSRQAKIVDDNSRLEAAGRCARAWKGLVKSGCLRGSGTSLG